MAKRKKRNLFSVLFFLIFGCAAGLFFLAPKLSWLTTSTTRAADETTSSNSSTMIQTATITAATIADLSRPIQHHYPAQVIATEHTPISSQLAGQITSLPVTLGDAVQSGQIIAELDCEQLAFEKDILLAQQSADEQQLTQSSKQQDRLNDLRTQGAATAAQIDEITTATASIKAKLKVLTANLNKLNNTLQKCQIRAPFPGTITQVSASVGQYATPGAPIVTLLNPASQRIESDLRPDIISKLTQTDSLAFTFNEVTIPVSILTINNAIDSTANSQKVRFSANDSDNQQLLAGAHGEIQWETGDALPAQYTAMRNNHIGVYVYNPDVANPSKRIHFVAIPGAQEGRSVKLPTDFDSNKLIVTVGQQHIEQDYPTTVIIDSPIPEN